MDGFGIPGRYMVSLNLAGYGQVTDLTGFEMLKLVEESANQLPTFELMFRTYDAGLLSFFSEGNTITAGMGVTQLELSGIPLKIMKKKITRGDAGTWRIWASGFYNALDYMNNTKTEISDKKSGIERMQEIASQHFQTDFSTTKSNDTMNWIQHGISNLEHMLDVWTHCDLGNNNFPMIGITTDGTFRLKTATDVVGEDYKFNFTNTEVIGGKNIPFHYDFEIESNGGFSNYWKSYSQTSDIINLDQGIGSLFTTVVGNILGQSSNLEQSSSVISKAAGSVVSNENNHENYHQSHSNNLANLASFSSSKLNISNSELFFPIKVLDKIMFSDQVDVGAGAVQSFSGQWVTDSVSRTIEHNQFHTSVIAVRESMNNVQNSS